MSGLLNLDTNAKTVKITTGVQTYNANVTSDSTIQIEHNKNPGINFFHTETKNTSQIYNDSGNMCLKNGSNLIVYQGNGIFQVTHPNANSNAEAIIQIGNAFIKDSNKNLVLQGLGNAGMYFSMFNAEGDFMLNQTKQDATIKLGSQDLYIVGKGTNIRDTHRMTETHPNPPTRANGNKDIQSIDFYCRPINSEQRSGVSGNKYYPTMSITSDHYIYVDGGLMSKSDYRLKSNIEPIDESITTLHLRPVQYIMNDSKNIGLVAHELQEQIPCLVTGEKDGADYQSVNYLGLIGVLIKDIQALHQRIADLEKKIN